MRRFSVFVTIALLAGFVIGYFARSAAGMLQRRTHAADLAAIEKAHQEDIEATLTHDPKRLIDLWAEDAVAFCPGSPPAVGKQAIGAVNEKFHAQNPRLQGVELHVQIQEPSDRGRLGMRVVRKNRRV